MESLALTAYEKNAVRRIALWKGRQPGFIARTVDILKRPLERRLKVIIRGDIAAKMIFKLNEAAEWQDGYNLIRREAKVQDLIELRSISLEQCDQLERQIEAAGTGLISSASLLAGIGGIVTELAAIPGEVLMALNAVHRVAGCYGYPLHGENDRIIVLAIIGLSMVEDVDVRTRWFDKIQAMGFSRNEQLDEEHLEESIAEEVRAEVTQDVVEELETTLLEQLFGESIPFLGSAVGIIFDNRFLSEIESTARYVMQERWLKDQGKVESIAPIEGKTELIASLKEGTYSVAYATGFGLTFPIVLAAKASASILPQPALNGFTDGAVAAAQKVGRLFPDSQRSPQKPEAISTSEIVPNPG